MNDILKRITNIVEEHSAYKTEAYTFVLAALNYTVKKLPVARHITGKELLEGIRDYAIEQFGPLARSVFAHWGISSTKDFGHIVFFMIEHGLLGKTEEDSLDDFIDIYDFHNAFDNAISYSMQ